MVWPEASEYEFCVTRYYQKTGIMKVGPPPGDGWRCMGLGAESSGSAYGTPSSFILWFRHKSIGEVERKIAEENEAKAQAEQAIQKAEELPVRPILQPKPRPDRSAFIVALVFALAVGIAMFIIR